MEKSIWHLYLILKFDRNVGFMFWTLACIQTQAVVFSLPQDIWPVMISTTLNDVNITIYHPFRYIARLITNFGSFDFSFLSLRLCDFPYYVFRLQGKTGKTKWKINKLLRNISLTSSPKITTNKVPKMGWKQHYLHNRSSRTVDNTP